MAENQRGPLKGPAESRRQALTGINSSSRLGHVLGRLEGVRRSGKGFTSKCPSHHDRYPSLSITEAAGGRVLVHCHAGCPPEAVVSALGLKLRDLFPESPSTFRKITGTKKGRGQRGPRHPVPRRVVEGLLERRSFPLEWEVAKVLARVPDLLSQRDILASWDYLEGRVDIELVVLLSRAVRESRAAA
jgi:hypothetical protein